MKAITARVLLAFSLLVVGAGCGAEPAYCITDDFPIEGAQAADPSAPPDRSCVGQQSVSGCNTLHLCGIATRILVRSGIADATYDFYDVDGTLLASATTDEHGAYCADVPVGPEAFRGRVRLSKEGYRSHDGYLAAYPIGVSHSDISLGIEQESDLVSLLPVFGAVAPLPDKGIVDPFILDCAYQWLAPVTVDIDRPYEQRYYLDAGKLNGSATASIAGELSGALFVNVEPGPITATFRSAATGEMLGTATGEVRAGHWTALPTFVN